MRAGLTLILIGLNVAALLSILGTRAARGRKLGWSAAVVLLPFAGALGWLLVARSRHSKAVR